MNTFVIIPGYNEEQYLEKVLRKVTLITDKVIYVDDGSTDKSVAIAKKYVTNVLVHEINLGKGAALKTGCEYVFKKLKADAVIFMDSDDQHNPEDIKEFKKLLETGASVVFGVRKFKADMPLIRFLGNKFASVLVNLLFHSYIPDIPSGFKALTKSAYKKVDWSSKSYAVETEIAAKVAKYQIPYSIHEIEITYHDTEKGMTLLDALQIMKFLLLLKFNLK